MRFVSKLCQGRIRECVILRRVQVSYSITFPVYTWLTVCPTKPLDSECGTLPVSLCGSLGVILLTVTRSFSDWTMQAHHSIQQQTQQIVQVSGILLWYNYFLSYTPILFPTYLIHFDFPWDHLRHLGSTFLSWSLENGSRKKAVLIARLPLTDCFVLGLRISTLRTQLFHIFAQFFGI